MSSIIFRNSGSGRLDGHIQMHRIVKRICNGDHSLALATSESNAPREALASMNTATRIDANPGEPGSWPGGFHIRTRSDVGLDFDLQAVHKD